MRPEHAEAGGPRRVLWASLPDQRPRRELHWLSLVPDTRVTAVGSPRPWGDVDWEPSRYRRPVTRFVEAGAFGWLRDLRDLDDAAPEHDWIASLETFSLVTGQAGRYARRHGLRQAVLLWNNDARHPLHHLPPYRQAVQQSRRADLFLCLVEGARRHLLEMGFPEERIEVVLPGVDTETFHPAGAPVAEPVACFVSPLAANKGIDRVLEAFALVRRRLPEARLLVMGRGPLEPMVRAAAQASGGAVEVVPAGGPTEVAAALRRAAVFVTAPRASRVWNEQFGLAYTEAMACGLPVVTTVCGTNHEAVVPPNHRVPDDAGALAEALVDVLGDPGWRARTGAANRAHVLARHEIRTQCRAMGAALRRAEAR